MMATSLHASLTQNSFISATSHLPGPSHSFQTSHYAGQNRTYSTSAKWRVSTGFRKLQKRINERHKSGKSSAAGVIRSRALPPITGEEKRRRSARLKEKGDNKVKSSRTVMSKARGGQSEFSASQQYELYRTSNNGLIRMLNNNRRKRLSLTSDFSDLTSDLDKDETTSCSQQTAAERLPEIDKTALLRKEIERLEKQHCECGEEDLEQRIVSWIRHCRMMDAADGAPYQDLDRRCKHSNPRQNQNQSPHRDNQSPNRKSQSPNRKSQSPNRHSKLKTATFGVTPSGGGLSPNGHSRSKQATKQGCVSPTESAYNKLLANHHNGSKSNLQNLSGSCRGHESPVLDSSRCRSKTKIFI